MRENFFVLPACLFLAVSLANSHLTEDIQDLEARLEEVYNKNNNNNSVEAMEERLSDLYNQEGEDERQGTSSKTAKKSKKKKKSKKGGTYVQ